MFRRMLATLQRWGRPNATQPPRNDDISAMGAALEGHTGWLTGLAQGLADLRAAHGAALRDLSNGLADIRAAQAVTTKSLEVGLSDLQAGHGAHLADLAAGLANMGAAHGAQLGDLGRWLSSTTQIVSALSSSPVISSPGLQAIGPPARLVDGNTAVARMAQVWSVGRWLEQAPIESTTLITIILPTRNRPKLLARAVASVLCQRHAALELIVVDDGSTPETARCLEGIADPRLKVLRTTGIGAAAARNLGQDAASGAFIAYLDDDNIMDSNWLRGVAWGFHRWPDTELLYGARIIEDGASRDGVPSGAMPAFEWLPFDRARLEQSNYIDMNVIAHRAGLLQARFDGELRACIEWEMLLRATAWRAPLELPVIACLYSSYAPGRLGNTSALLSESRKVRARVHTTRPMRVLSYNAVFPLMSETYIEEEMLALEANGASVAFATHGVSASPYAVGQPVYAGLDEGVAMQDPDVIVVYWASHALSELDRLGRIGRPFALRVHSFDFDVADLARVRDHPGCVGIWAFPHQAAMLPGAHSLVPIFTTHAALPESSLERRTVASISAGLPKKNWPLLLEAMDALDDLDRVIVMARTNGLENLPGEVAGLAASREKPPAVRINVPRRDVFDLLAGTSVLLYTVTTDSKLGMPMSVIEGLRAGACVVTPDRPEMKALCGDGFRPYTSAADIVTHVREVFSGGPAIDRERIRNREWALDHFCDPALGRRFHDELSAAVTAWRERRQID